MNRRSRIGATPAPRTPALPEPEPAEQAVPETVPSRWLAEDSAPTATAVAEPDVARWLPDDEHAHDSDPHEPSASPATDWLAAATAASPAQGGGPESRWTTGAPAATLDTGHDPSPARWLPAGASSHSSAVVDAERRARAVRAYCGELCEPQAAAAAAELSLAAFEATGASDDDALLRITRVTAAEHAAPVAEQRGWRGALTAEHQDQCRATHKLLAARANGDLDAAGEEELAKHLRTCLQCQAAELRSARAERAFAALLGGTTAVWTTEHTHETPANGVAAATAGVAAADAVGRWEPPEQPTESAHPGLATAAIGASALAAPPYVKTPPWRTGTRGRRRLRLAGAGALLGVVAIVAIVLALSGGSTKTPTAAGTSAASSTPAPAPTHAAATPHKKPAAHKPAHKPAKKPATKPPVTVAAAPATGSPTVAGVPVSSSPTPSAPSSPAPTPTPAPPPPSSGPSASPPTLSQQGNGLGSAPAPTQGISPPKH